MTFLLVSFKDIGNNVYLALFYISLCGLSIVSIGSLVFKTDNQIYLELQYIHQTDFNNFFFLSRWSLNIDLRLYRSTFT